MSDRIDELMDAICFRVDCDIKCKTCPFSELATIARKHEANRMEELRQCLRADKAEAERDALLAERTLVDIVFDGPPSHESGRFIDVESMSGASVGIGEWIDRGNGYWALRIPTTTPRG